jgi:hypothetical protein
VRDTGALGARVLRDAGKYAGNAYNFSGIRSNYEVFANAFSEVLGRPITYVASTLEQADQSMRARQMPDWLITHLLAVARASANGAFAEELTQPIRDILGRARSVPRLDRRWDLPDFFGPVATGEWRRVRGPGFSVRYEGESAAIASMLSPYSLGLRPLRAR